MERIVQIDSTFVNKNIYPYDTDFIIPINGTPNYDGMGDSRCVSYTQDQVVDRFLWVGNSTINVFTDISANAVEFTFFVLDNSTLVANFDTTVPPPDVPFVPFDLYLKNVVNKNNYFVGCFFYFQGYCSQITQYNGVMKQMSLLTPFPFSLTTTSNQTGYIINPSQVTPNNLVVLLESSFTLTQTLQDLLGVKTLNRSQTVWQVRTNTQHLIQTFTPISRDVVLDPGVFDYRSHDLFLICPLQRYLLGSVQGKFWYQGMYEWELLEGGRGYQKGDVVQVSGLSTNAFLTVSSTNQGRITVLEMQSPGDGFLSTVYNLEAVVPSLGTGGSLRVKRIAPYFKAGNVAQPNRKWMVFFPDFQIHLPLQYFIVLGVVGDVVYLSTDRTTIDTLNDPDAFYNLDNPTAGATLVAFVPYNNYYPMINLPIVPFHQTVCYRIQIASIALPNLPVCGYNILLATFPYVLVTLMNSTSGSTSGGENYGLMISNNPHAVRSTFVCPIANIRNPDYVRFVVVNSNQSIMMKFRPSDALRFTVNLPNGELLKFQNNEGVCEKSTPLTHPYTGMENVNPVYTFHYRRSLVSVTFTMELVGQ